MRIVIDLQAMQTESRLRGIGRYATSFVSALIRQSDRNDLVFVLSDLFGDTIEPLTHGPLAAVKDRICIFRGLGPVRASDSSALKNREFEELSFQTFIENLAPDLVLIMSPFEGFVDDALTLRSSARFPIATIIYDLIPYVRQEEYLPSSGIYREFYLDKIDTIKKYDVYLTISEYSRHELIRYLDVDPSKVRNIDGAVDDVFCRSEDSSLICDIVNVGEYILYTGGADPRKNLKRLFTAYASLPIELKERHKIVMAGRVPEGEKIALEAHARALNISTENIIWLGYVSDDVLAQLYSHCRIFIFPSYHEGLGLPVLEAMHCGAAVIAANATSLPQLVVLEDALFDPLDVVSISTVLKRSLCDEDFHDKLVRNAHEQAHKYSWDRTAALGLEALESTATLSKVSFSAFAREREKRDAALIQAAREPALPFHSSKMLMRKAADRIAKNSLTAERSARRNWDLQEPLQWRLEGPFDSTYSLALLNRETARALEKLGHCVVLHSTEGPGDFEPSEAFLRENLDLASMHSRAKQLSAMDCQVQSRNLYPPRVADMSGNVKILHHYAWEESGFPQEWVDEFNDYLSGITCLSEHVKKILIDNGVVLPLTRSGCGISHWDRVEADRQYAINAKDFRFLHVSSCFPRKGVSVLLQSFGKAFRHDDNVSLVVKTFPNPHNDIHHQLRALKEADPFYPDVVVIEDDLSDSELKSLYEQCHALVAPSFAEGFGLPLAEALLSGLPVITTGWGGQLDFCNPKTAWLVDFEFRPSQSHLGLYNSVWAVPSVQSLSESLVEVFNANPAEIKAKVDTGRALLRDNFTWEQVANRLVMAARDFGKNTVPANPRIGWITTWATKCGIATYSEHLLRNFPQDVYIYARDDGQSSADYNSTTRFTWKDNGFDDLSETTDWIIKDNIEVLFIQFNYGFFVFDALSNIILRLKERGIIVIITLHSTIDPQHDPQRKLIYIVDSLKKCNRILVHSHHDMNRLKQYGLIDNVTLVPHGVLDYATSPGEYQIGRALKVATYGFFLPHKGLHETIEAFRILKGRGVNAELHMVNSEYPAPVSASLVAKARDLIDKYGLQDRVKLTSDFLSDAESLRHLSDADVILYPYQPTAESASGAVRYGLAVGRTVAVTPTPIFDDLKGAVVELPNASPEGIADGIMELLNAMASNSIEFLETRDRAYKWRDQHLYSKISRRLSGMAYSLWANEHHRDTASPS